MAVPGYEVTVAQVLAAALVLVCLPAPRQMWELFQLHLLSRVLHWPLRRAP
ncbi:UNVERIFIED_CONTAM: hypothetical protein RF653_03765 [Kocuria sp. CPCC 205316]|uniref:hypothetical protein n=1 Tax=Kocuria TaxID=57493 RepID=UPI0036DB34FB